MKLINQSVELFIQSEGIEGIYKQIERAGRTCYKSEDKITENSAKEFVDRLTKAKHFSMLEHGTVYLTVHEIDFNDIAWVDKYVHNQYSKVEYVTDYSDITLIPKKVAYVTTNYRVLVENNWLDDLKYISKPTEHHNKRITAHFVIPIGISREFLRHRKFSFAEQSTRYCNYSKDKFGNELTFIKPYWYIDMQELNKNHNKYSITDSIKSNAFFIICSQVEDKYRDLVKYGAKPQEAREILPLSLKTELVMTGFMSDWKHFFDLRLRGTTGAPHPQAKEAASIAHEAIRKSLNINI